MKVFGFVLLVVGVVLVAVYQQRIILVETYLLSTKMPHGWVVIEYENPRCKPLRDRLFERRFVIPESGYLCIWLSLHIKFDLHGMAQGTILSRRRGWELETACREGVDFATKLV